MEDSVKLASNTFSLTYTTGETVLGKPSSFRDLEDIEVLQKEIVRLLASCDGCLADLVSLKNKEFWGHVEKLAALIPVVGQKEKGIKLDLIDDVDDILRIFVTCSNKRDPETGALFLEAGEKLERSEVCRINSLNFFRMLREVQLEIQQQDIQKKDL